MERRRYFVETVATDRYPPAASRGPILIARPGLEAAVDGLLIACLYLLNGNPQPGPKFDYKMKWFSRLARHAAQLQKQDHPALLVGDYNVAPTDLDIYPTKSWTKDALVQPAPRKAFASLLANGWTDALRDCLRR